MPEIYGILDNHQSVKGSYYEVRGNIHENPELLEGK
jgi:hypothetical protein